MPFPSDQWNSNKPGFTKVLSPIEVKGNPDEPAVDSSRVKGGSIYLQTLAERATIPKKILKLRVSRVYVAETDTYYVPSDIPDTNDPVAWQTEAAGAGITILPADDTETADGQTNAKYVGPLALKNWRENYLPGQNQTFLGLKLAGLLGSGNRVPQIAPDGTLQDSTILIANLMVKQNLSRTFFIDNVNGVDATGEKGNIVKRYKTFASALAVASANDIFYFVATNTAYSTNAHTASQTGQIVILEDGLTWSHTSTTLSPIFTNFNSIIGPNASVSYLNDASGGNVYGIADNCTKVFLGTVTVRNAIAFRLIGQLEIVTKLAISRTFTVFPNLGSGTIISCDYVKVKTVDTTDCALFSTSIDIQIDTVNVLTTSPFLFASSTRVDCKQMIFKAGSTNAITLTHGNTYEQIGRISTENANLVLTMNIGNILATDQSFILDTPCPFVNLVCDKRSGNTPIRVLIQAPEIKDLSLIDTSNGYDFSLQCRMDISIKTLNQAILRNHYKAIIFTENVQINDGVIINPAGVMLGAAAEYPLVFKGSAIIKRTLATNPAIDDPTNNAGVANSKWTLYNYSDVLTNSTHTAPFGNTLNNLVGSARHKTPGWFINTSSDPELETNGLPSRGLYHNQTL